MVTSSHCIAFLFRLYSDSIQLLDSSEQFTYLPRPRSVTHHKVQAEVFKHEHLTEKLLRSLEFLSEQQPSAGREGNSRCSLHISLRSSSRPCRNNHVSSRLIQVLQVPEFSALLQHFSHGCYHGSSRDRYVLGSN